MVAVNDDCISKWSLHTFLFTLLLNMLRQQMMIGRLNYFPTYIYSNSVCTQSLIYKQFSSSIGRIKLLSGCWNAFTGLYGIVHTFNSCTGRLDICQCLVVQTIMGNMSKIKPNKALAHVACESNIHSVVRSSIHP